MRLRLLQRNLTENQFRERISEIFFAAPTAIENETNQKLDSEDSVSSAGDRNMVSD